jgi:hypothetical protein
MQAGNCASLKDGAKTSGSTHNPLVKGSNPFGPRWLLRDNLAESKSKAESGKIGEIFRSHLYPRVADGIQLVSARGPRIGFVEHDWGGTSVGKTCKAAGGELDAARDNLLSEIVARPNWFFG